MTKYFKASDRNGAYLISNNNVKTYFKTIFSCGRKWYSIDIPEFEPGEEAVFGANPNEIVHALNLTGKVKISILS